MTKPSLVIVGTPQWLARMAAAGMGAMPLCQAVAAEPSLIDIAGVDSLAEMVVRGLGLGRRLMMPRINYRYWLGC